jgi:hypothetical protein
MPITPLPTQFTTQRTLPQYTLDYAIPNFEIGDVTRNDLVELENLTFQYLQNHFFGAISSGDIILEDFVTEIVASEDDLSFSGVRVTFESTALFDPLSPVFPTTDQLVMELMNAFTGEELNGYLGMVQALPADTNAFSSTTQIILEGTAPTRVGSESPLIAAIAAAAAGFAIFSFASTYFAYYFHRRRRHRRRAASNKFMSEFSELEAPTEEVSSRKSFDDGDGNESNDGDNNNDARSPSWRTRLGMHHFNAHSMDKSRGKASKTWQSEVMSFRDHDNTWKTEVMSFRDHDCLEEASGEDDGMDHDGDYLRETPKELDFDEERMGVPKEHFHDRPSHSSQNVHIQYPKVSSCDGDWGSFKEPSQADCSVFEGA